MTEEPLLDRAGKWTLCSVGLAAAVFILAGAYRLLVPPPPNPAYVIEVSTGAKK